MCGTWGGLGIMDLESWSGRPLCRRLALIAFVVGPSFGGVAIQVDRLVPIAEHVHLGGGNEGVVGARVLVSRAFRKPGTRPDKEPDHCPERAADPQKEER